MRIFLVFILLFSIVFPASVVAEQPLYDVTSFENIEMVTTASNDGRKIATLPKGTKVLVVAQKNDWTRIDLNGRLGWVPSEALEPFTENLWPVYTAYYQVLQQTDNIIYALLTDFTRDGVEDLYIVTDADSSTGNYTEIIYSGDQVIYQKSRTEGLMILQDGLQHYIRHDSSINREGTFSLKQLNNQARTDYYEASANNERYQIQTNVYINMIHLLRAAEGTVAEKVFISEEITSKDFFGAELVNEYNESIYLQRRAERINGQEKELTEADFVEAFRPYSQAKVVVKIYEDHYKSAVLSEKFVFNKQRILAELIKLAEAHQPVVESELVVEEELEILRDKLAQSIVLELPFSAGERLPQHMVKQVLLAQQPSAVQNTQGEYGVEQELVGESIRAFYGIKLDPTLEIADVKLVDRKYVTKQIPLEENRYRQLLGVRELAKDFIAVQFTDYQLPQDIVVDALTEQQLIAGQHIQDGFVIFKRIANNWLYIDTVQTTSGINMLHYEDYTNQLAVKESKPIEKELASESASTEPLQEKGQTKEQSQPIAAGLLITICVIIFSFGFGYSFFVYKYKRGNV